jgi:hypothetical protein
MCSLQGKAHNDRVTNGPEVVELSVHVAEGRPVLPHGIVQIRTLVGDTYGLVSEDAIVGEKRLPSFEVHSFGGRIRVANKCFGVKALL